MKMQHVIPQFNKAMTEKQAMIMILLLLKCCAVTESQYALWYPQHPLCWESNCGGNDLLLE